LLKIVGAFKDELEEAKKEDKQGKGLNEEDNQFIIIENQE
jgi:hypothetical protein